MTTIAYRAMPKTPSATLDAIWSEAYADAKRRDPCNVYKSGSPEASAYERGYLAGMLARTACA